MKKLWLLLIIPIVVWGQNVSFNSDGHYFPQIDGNKWLGSEASRFYMMGTKNMVIKGENGSLKLKTDGGFQSSIEFWADKPEPMAYLGVRPGDNYRFYLSGLGGMGGNAGRSDIAIISTNLFDPNLGVNQREIETFGNLVHSGNFRLTGGRVNLGGGSDTPLVATTTTTIPTKQSSRSIKSTGGAITSVAIPTLEPGVIDGDLFWLHGTDADATVTIQGEDIFNGSRIRFPSGTPSTRVVALYKTYAFRWSAQANVWIMWAETTPPASSTAGLVSNEPYGPTWENIAGTAPSQGAVFAKLESLPGASPNTVLATSAFASDNRLIVSDGTANRNVKYSPVTVDALGNVTGVNNITMTNPFPTGVYSTNTFTNDNRILRSDGPGRSAQSSSVQLDDNGTINIVAGSPLVYPQNTMQSFNPGSTSAGINVGSFNGIPSSIINGGIWYYTAKQCLYAMYASSSSQYAISPRDEINLYLKDFKSSGSPAPVFDQTEDTDKWTFIDDQTSVIQCQFPIGHSWGSTANVYLMFSMATATSGNVVFALQTMQSFFGNAEAVNGTGYTGAVNLPAAAAPTTLGGLGVAQGSLPMDGVTGPGTAVLFKLRIHRRGADAGDTALGEVKLHAVKVDWVRVN